MAETAITSAADMPDLALSGRPSALLWVIFLNYFTLGMITNVIGVIIPEVIKQYYLSLLPEDSSPLMFGVRQ